MTRTNGSPLMEELKPSEPGAEETTALVTNSDTTSESMLPLLSDHTLELTKTESDGTLDQEETSETTDRNVSMFMVTPTLTKDTLSSTTATMVLTKPGGLIKDTSHGQDNHSKMESDSKSDQE
jgi:saccharopine dehydrogenase-like NADP-dependent oxidoreductase